jgi:hypothetical protein
MLEPARPPCLAGFLLSFFRAEPDLPTILGDLAEEFQQHVRAAGLRAARRWYWRETFRNAAELGRRPGLVLAAGVAATCAVAVHFFLRSLGWLLLQYGAPPLGESLHPLLGRLLSPALAAILGLGSSRLLVGQGRTLSLVFAIAYAMVLMHMCWYTWSRTHAFFDWSSSAFRKPVWCVAAFGVGSWVGSLWTDHQRRRRMARSRSQGRSIHH